MNDLMNIERVSDYLREEEKLALEDKRKEFESIFKTLKRFKPIGEGAKMLEIGVGTGWLQVFCKQEGIQCKGLEVNPKLADYARQFCRRNGVDPEIEIGDIAHADLGEEKYDFIVATSTFEHVRHWEIGLGKVFDALKPGGLFYFYSTNKFSFAQGEYDFPLYSWMPDSWRYRLRKARDGEDIMKWGIDFNQFTYFHLRRVFSKLGFSKVLDLVEILDPDNLNNPRAYKQLVLRTLKRVPPLRHLVLFFSGGTLFACIK